MLYYLVILFLSYTWWEWSWLISGVLWAGLELVNGLEALTHQRNLFLAFLAIDTQVWGLRVCF